MPRPLVPAQVQHHPAAVLGDPAQRGTAAAGRSPQRWEPNTSPVRHSECTRTSTSWPSPMSPGDQRDGLHAVVRAGGSRTRGSRRTRSAGWCLASRRTVGSLERAVRDQVGDRDDRGRACGRNGTSSGSRANGAVLAGDLHDAAAGRSPASRARSTPASVCGRGAPAPAGPGRAAGRRAPGGRIRRPPRRVRPAADGGGPVAAEIPVVTPCAPEASTETVKAVRIDSVLASTICGRSAGPARTPPWGRRSGRGTRSS